ncbi:MAG: hypothetical protein OXC82_01795 [Rhodobacteraceae bacterium]|nr:hypothetical protein [Paracoccaceae bacterium]
MESVQSRLVVHTPTQQGVFAASTAREPVQVKEKTKKGAVQAPPLCLPRGPPANPKASPSRLAGLGPSPECFAQRWYKAG